ncbi:MAG: PorT family protein [Prevotellaceae bacterium]|jgi:hypothetical protein|nr:PorT family protein [Prevotellaceae bacterium]
MKKTMKVTLVAGLIIFGATTANAQLGIQAGYVNSKFNTKNTFLKYAHGDKGYNGFEVGLTYDMGIQGPVGLHYGVLYTMTKNNKDLIAVGGNSITAKRTGHYLNVPFRLTVGGNVSNAVRLFAYGGPNFTIGLSGKTTNTANILNVSGGKDYSWYGDHNEALSRFDLKLGLGAGVQFHHFVLTAGYDWGLINSVGLDNSTLKRNQLNVSLGYQF